MNNRERFWQVMRYKEYDSFPFWGDWLGPYDRWIKEGLPPHNKKLSDLEQISWFSDYFKFDGMYSVFWGTSRVSADIGVCPEFNHDVIEETDRYIVAINPIGCKTRQLKDKKGNLTSEQFLEFPIKNRDDWNRFKEERLNPKEPSRYPAADEWEAEKKKWKNRTYPISIDGGSFYGFLRDWIGVENVSVMFYDNPNLIGDILDYLSGFFIEVIGKGVSEVDIDFAMFWEDMCYKTGPLISPAMFREFLLPNYKRVTSFLRKNGVELSWVDCDGNIDALLPLWLEGGVKGFYPLEVAADMDAVKVQAQYGKDVVLWGNVDKRAISAGKDAIDAEIRRLEPAVKTGGFIPLVDHMVPHDISLDNYLYYLEKRKQLCGII